MHPAPRREKIFGVSNFRNIWINAAALAFAVAVCALLAACEGDADDFADDEPIGEAPALGAHARQADIDGGAMTLARIVERGERVFTASFNTLDGAGRPESTDTSPDNFRARRVFPDNFNRVSGPDANSCASCHTIPILGGGGDNASNVFVLADRLEFVNFDGGAGDGGERHALKTVGNERTSVSLFGAGYVELLAREMTADLHAIRDSARRDAKASGKTASAELVSKGVRFGRLSANPDGTLDANLVEGVDADLVIRPFMQKGTITSLREFAVKAMNQHFGMQASEQFGDAADPDADGVADELTRGDLTALALFQATLPAPREIAPSRDANRQAAERGRGIFSEIACSACHIPELPLYSAEYSEPNPFNPAGKLQAFEVENPFIVNLAALDGAPDFRRAEDGAIMIPVFTDFKRHKMGEILNNETLEEEGVPTDEWLTRKLWGFASEPPFLHHGRATLISEAILAHGGEAQSSRDAFAALPQGDEDALIEFLKTLRIPENAPEPGYARRDIWLAVMLGVIVALGLLAIFAAIAAIANLR